MAATVGMTWDALDAVCPNDGVTPAQGSVGGVDLTGWVWATRPQVLELLSEFVPQLAHSPAVSGPEYVLTGLSFFGQFKATWEFYTTTGGFFSLSAWSATAENGLAFAPAASAQYPVFHGAFSVQAQVPTADASFDRGAWMFQPAPGPFQSVGAALCGSYGAPGLQGSGTPVAGAPVTLSIAHGNPGGVALMIIGLGAVNLPTHGGVLVPALDIVLGGLPLDAGGAFSATLTWPAGMPAGLPLHIQAWMPDRFAVAGFSATNGLKLLTP